MAKKETAVPEANTQSAQPEKPIIPTITIVIPLDPLNKNDLIVPVRLDSLKEHYEMEITRGVPTEVPIPVYNVLKEAGYITGLA